MTKHVLVHGMLAASIAISIAALTMGADEKQPASFWMKKKLQYSEKVLEGLAKADYETIAENAKLMNQLDQIEDFVRGRDEEYRHHLKTFDRVTRELAQQANDEDIDGATLAFMELTLNCVNCHKHLRDRKDSGSKE